MTQVRSPRCDEQRRPNDSLNCRRATYLRRSFVTRNAKLEAIPESYVDSIIYAILGRAFIILCLCPSRIVPIDGTPCSTVHVTAEKKHLIYVVVRFYRKLPGRRHNPLWAVQHRRDPPKIHCRGCAVSFCTATPQYRKVFLRLSQKASWTLLISFLGYPQNALPTL